MCSSMMLSYSLFYDAFCTQILSVFVKKIWDGFELELPLCTLGLLVTSLDQLWYYTNCIICFSSIFFVEVTSNVCKPCCCYCCCCTSFWTHFNCLISCWVVLLLIIFAYVNIRLIRNAIPIWNINRLWLWQWLHIIVFILLIFTCSLCTKTCMWELIQPLTNNSPISSSLYCTTRSKITHSILYLGLHDDTHWARLSTLGNNSYDTPKSLSPFIKQTSGGYCCFCYYVFYFLFVVDAHSCYTIT